MKLTTVGAPTPQVSETTVTRADAPKVLEYKWGGFDMRWELEGWTNPMESTLQKPAFVAAKATPKATTRWVFRWIHLIFSIPAFGYIYSRLTKFQTTPPPLGLSSFLCRQDGRQHPHNHS